MIKLPGSDLMMAGPGRDFLRFGARRAHDRDRHRYRVTQFRRRHCQLAIMCALFVIVGTACGIGVFLALAGLLASAGAGEAWRMRACGRYWQCRRSMEVIGI